MKRFIAIDRPGRKKGIIDSADYPFGMVIQRVESRAFRSLIQMP